VSILSTIIRRSVLVVVLSLLVVAAGIVLVSQRASAASSTPVVYVATGENFPDALGAAAAAAVQGGPVLLVRNTSIPAATAAELARLSPNVIYVAGGTNPRSW
jgi:putative cell wall-binding protein